MHQARQDSILFSLFDEGNFALGSPSISPHLVRRPIFEFVQQLERSNFRDFNLSSSEFLSLLGHVIEIYD
jgi:hypothetical protein